MADLSGTARCPRCKSTFHYTLKVKKGQPEPRAPMNCGMMACRVEDEWGTEDWEGAARMAFARRGAGIELNDVDERALARFPNPEMTGPRR